MQEAKDHFELLKEDYKKQVDKLTKLVDGAVDPVDFMKASGKYVSLYMSYNTLHIILVVHCIHGAGIIVSVSIKWHNTV